MDSASYGQPQLQIKPLYIRAALELLVNGAEKLRAKKLITTETDENPITYYLSAEMANLQRAGKSDIISWDFRVHTQSDPSNPQSICEIDFKFRWSEYPSDYDHYLAAEAKRLFGRGDSLAGKYVDDGIMDFVTAKYGRGHNYGIMLGYVLIGPLINAVTSVSYAMAGRRAKTAECSEFAPDASLCPHPHTHHSTHLQKETFTPITLVHVFLDFS
jgi:hypothetical protein